ncbi:MAG: PilZ domain-containing protein [Phycisphaerales bacterium]|nr:PilZ domain-containing protein [Phycisphaerales bacterium]
MKTALPLNVAKADALLREAAACCLPVCITWQRRGGGVDTGRARLLDIDEDDGGLWITRPAEWRASEVRIPADGRISVSFEYGMKTCQFESRVVKAPIQDDAARKHGPPVKLEWPTEVIEQQRRRFDRVGVPAGCSVPVTVYRLSDGGDTAQSEPLLSGRMLDLSPGGLSMELSADQDLMAQDDDRVICAFATDTGGPRLKVWGRVRHGKRTGRGNLRLGMQFLDLDVGLQGQSNRKNIISLASKFSLM